MGMRIDLCRRVLIQDGYEKPLSRLVTVIEDGNRQWSRCLSMQPRNSPLSLQRS